MDAPTRELVRRKKVALQEERAAERKEEAARKQAVRQLEADMVRAVLEVNSAAREVATRLGVEPNKWVSEGTVERVCNWVGPHNGFWCFFHRTKRVTLIEIPGARGGCSKCSRSNHYGQRYYGGRHMKLYLGSNGRVYRYGHTKIFEARFMDRGGPSYIRPIARKIRRME